MLARALLLGASLSLVPAVAFAQKIDTPPVGAAQGGDTVGLKDGTVLHGTIGEMTPGQAVTIKLGDGTTRTIDWSAIDRVNIDRAKAPPAPPPPPARPTTVVHLDGVDGAEVVLQRLDNRSGSEPSWVTVCRGACDRPLPSDAIYRVDGPGMRTSRSFQLPHQAEAAYHVERASSAGFIGGLTLVIVGGAGAANGVGFLILGAAWQGTYLQGTANDYLIGGGIALGVGIAALITGILVMKPNSRTTVAPLQATGPAIVPAWRETPAWMPRTAGIGVPLLGGTF